MEKKKTSHLVNNVGFIKKSPIRLSKSLNSNILKPKLNDEIEYLSNSTLMLPNEEYVNEKNSDLTKAYKCNDEENSYSQENIENKNQNVCNNFKTPNMFFINNSESEDEEEIIKKKEIKDHIDKNNTKMQKKFPITWIRKTMGRIGNKNQTYNVNDYQISSNSNQNSYTDSVASIIRRQQSFKMNQDNSIWSLSTKQGQHIWSDFEYTGNESCYLSHEDALYFHNINKNSKCNLQTKVIKKCLICKMIVHETCIEAIQNHVKCKITFCQASYNSKNLKEDQKAILFNSNVNLHHWLCCRYEETKFDNKCQHCSKNYTSRFGIQPSRNIIFCTWCKISFHAKCFATDLLQEECNYGEFSSLIVPPCWIFKSDKKNLFETNLFTFLSTSKYNQENNNSNFYEKKSLPILSCTNENEYTNLERNYFVRPISNQQFNTMHKPILVLINPKSGGKLGPKLLKRFSWFLNPRQVFDLSLTGPKFCLNLYRNVPNLRILVGGGDGTVGWILSEIDKIRFLVSSPSVAVLPLGTGNDLARALNWGSGYTDEPLSKILNRVLESRIIKLDRWKISIKPNFNSVLTDFIQEASALKNDTMNNYFSLGADAHVCLEFHEKREANPNRFTNRWFNLFTYLESGSKDMIKKTWRHLKDYISLECDGNNYTDIIKSRGYHCIIFLNIPKYSSGTNPWGSFQCTKYKPQAMNDGCLEVIGCYTSTLAKLQLGGNGERLCQAKKIKLTTSACIPVQIDGEPAKLNPSIIEIFHKNQATMLQRIKNNDDSTQNLNTPKNIHNNFEVKFLLEKDFDTLKMNRDKLRHKALNVGLICSSNLTDSLKKARSTIELLLKNSEISHNLTNWTFLHGDEFFKIIDESEICLIDLVSSDGIIYILILDETSDNLKMDSENVNINERGDSENLPSSFEINNIQNFQFNTNSKIVPIIKP